MARDLYWVGISENAVARQIVDAAYRVHTTLGPGLLESVYEAALAYELEKRRLRITRQQAIPVVYETVHILTGFHAGLVVEDAVIVEIKALERIAPVHKKQLLTYLKLAGKRLGLLITSMSPLSKTASPASSTDSKTIHSHWTAPQGPLFRGAVREKA